MTENQIWTLIVGILKTGLTGAYPTVKVRQDAQPAMTGTPSGPAVLLHTDGARRYGYLKRDDVIELDGSATHTETQKYELKIQCGALYPQDPADTTGPTATDLVEAAATIMQSDATRVTLLAVGVGIYRVTDIRTPQFQDDRDVFEASPSFDFTLNYSNVSTSTIPAANRAVAGIHAV